MSIESHLENEAKSNRPRHFKDVVGKLLNEKESEDARPFKWEEEITDEDWKKVEAEIMNEYAGEGYIDMYHSTTRSLLLLHDMYMLKPDYQHTFPNKVIEGVEDKFHESKGGRNLDVAAISLAVLHRLKETKEDLNNYDAQMFEKHTSKTPIERIEFQLSLLLLDPYLYKKIPEEKLNIIDHFITASRKEHKLGFATGLVLYKLLGIPYPPLSEEEWDRLLSRFEKEKNNIDTKFDNAAILRILAAHKVEFIDGDLVITDTPPQSLDTTTPPRPIRKKK